MEEEQARLKGLTSVKTSKAPVFKNRFEDFF